MRSFFQIILFASILISVVFAYNEINAESTEFKIPDWIRNNALWLSQGLIDDADFISGMKYLIDQEIMRIPASQPSTEPQLPFVPHWIKDTAGWWANKKVTDADFVNGMQYLISNGYMTIPTSAIECHGEKLCLTGKVVRILQSYGALSNL